MSELNWGWQTIATTLTWKLAPLGLVLDLIEDVAKLPRERAFLLDRRPDGRIILSWIREREVAYHWAPERGENRASHSQLEGLWHKYTVCAAWHFVRSGKFGKRDVVTLTEQDRQAVPDNLILQCEGHGAGQIWRFLPRAEAAKIADWDRDNEGILQRFNQ